MIYRILTDQLFRYEKVDDNRRKIWIEKLKNLHDELSGLAQEFIDKMNKRTSITEIMSRIRTLG